MNWFEVLQWRSESLAEWGCEAERHSRELQQAAESLTARLNSLTGRGQTNTAVRQAFGQRISSIEEQVNYLISVSEIASAGVDGIDEIRADIADIFETLGSLPIHIDTGGVVSLVSTFLASSWNLATHPLEMTKIIAERVAKVLAKASALETKLAGMIVALGLGTYDNHVNYSASGSSRPSLPPAGASEQEVASWWANQSDANKQWLIDNYPEKIGNLDGVDGTSRDKANRKVLDQKLEDLPGQISELEKQAAYAPPFLRNAILKKKAELQHELDELKVVKTTLDKTYTDPETKGQGDNMPRQLLGLDSSGHNLKAIVAIGNVDTADDVGVVVPGLHTNVKDTLDDYDDRALALMDNAKDQVKTGESVAMVEYLGYDAPQKEYEAATTVYADKGAVRLASFLNGMDASREHGVGDAHMTVFGHSYGSTTSGKAAALVNEGVVDDIVLAGSPGAGVQKTSEYHVPQGHAWVSAAPYAYDLVQGLGTDVNFGKNPDTMPGFNRLSGDVGPPPEKYDPFGLHMAYFLKETEANYRIAGVIAGAGRN